MRQLMGINGEKFLFLEHELFAKCSELMRQCRTVTCPLSLRRHPRRVSLRRCGFALDEFTVRFLQRKGFVYRLAMDATRQGDDVPG